MARAMNPATHPSSALPLLRARRVVVKVGSALLVDAQEGAPNRAWLETLAADVAAIRARGQEVLLVSSGAIALGRRQLGLTSARLKLEEKQAAAAVGQIRLAHAWKDALELHRLSVAQILLTFGDTEERRRYLNARNTLSTLLRLGAIPVINENDTVATAEIRYGDNDRLAARVAQMISADCLVLLSDVDGLYSADPAARSGRAVHPGRAFDQPGDRTHGRRHHVGGRLRRHGDEDRCGEDRGRGRLPHGGGARPRVASAPPHRGGRALYLVSSFRHARNGSQAMDRRCAQAGGRAACR